MSSKTERPYKMVVFAGTFDHLHEGHRHLLRTALALGDTVGIGITKDVMLEGKSDRHKMQSFSERLEALNQFLSAEGANHRCQIFPIDTPEGGADRMQGLEALVVSDELSVVENAFRINELRRRNRLRPFHIVVVPRVRTSDGRPLSSSRRRAGEDFDPTDLVY
ncbi:MAG: pantetheine-phosphate adenylyltransferase [Candidatus Thorarchaeota archaeon]|nr:pantetheine-phosphate adenylyltransferase [Candidatus Thorarchaeota archaeon]